MTHFQDLFIRNLRYYRTQRGYNQFQFSIMIDLSPNYLNAVENGKNFPSPDVIQRMVTVLDILPYQLFLEHPVDTSSHPQNILKDAEKIIQSLTSMKQEFVQKFDAVITQLKT